MDLYKMDDHLYVHYIQENESFRLEYLMYTRIHDEYL
jgi:hypothetical protein